MPYKEINGASLYYETFGQEKPGKAPIVLIHGATGTGRSNWSVVAPLLGRDYYVVAPDCRGHGKSSNPNHSYTFKEMAADTAALVRALGYERAHIIGHSNGGNVATVILLEHPEVVQTAILQAANAWVSPDLVEKEPPLFDPDRVKRDSPDWMNRLIDLHSDTHGPEYWRELLVLTVNEIIREPNYTPEDLRAVRRPTLVIQGEKDSVNAPYKHAQYIARYVPAAELWLPAHIGHTVHDEILFQWMEKVLDFLKRRGEEENDSIYRLGQKLYADRRVWIFNVHAQPFNPDGQDEIESLLLTGQTLTGEQRQAVLDLFPGRALEDKIQVLLAESTPWALVTRGVTDLRREPRRLSERFSQALLGEAVRILEEGGDWIKVRLENDGYIGWMQESALHRCEKTQVDRFRDTCNHLIIEETAAVFDSSVNGNEIGKLPFGVSVPVIDREKGMAGLRLPNGSCWWVDEKALLPLSNRPQPTMEGISRALDRIQGFMGVPYLWGGRTPFGFDCSGLASTFWGFMGVQLPRDADQQSKIGTPVEAQILPGDLLFFGESREDTLPGEPGGEAHKITHVTISLGGSQFIHATGSRDCVTVNSIDPENPAYSEWLEKHLVCVRRLI